INPTGSALVYSTYLGGTGSETPFGIAVHNNQAHITGDTTSTNFPVTSTAFRTTSAGSDDAFVTKLSATGTSLAYSTYLGGSGQDLTTCIATDPTGIIFVAGETISSNFPTKAPAGQSLPPFRSVFAGGTDAFVSKIDPFSSGANSLVYSTFLGGS